MATAVLDLDLSAAPADIAGLNRYDRALVLIRWCGHPVGVVELPVAGGRLDGQATRRAMIDRLDWAFWERWLRDRLGEPAPARRPATVAICTRERPDDLQRALEAVTRGLDDGDELLVIDNAPSSDATRRVVERFPVARYVCETRQGLDVARNRALREARWDVVAFTDDDAVPDRGWLRALLPPFADPLVLCVTGLTMPLELETPAQEAFERYAPFGRGFRRRVFDGTRDDPLAVGHVGAGANMAIRRSALEVVGPFDEALDAGTASRTGGDHEMFARILAAGYRIVYEPDALSWHRHRRAWPEVRQTAYGYGVGVYAMWTRLLFEAGEVGVLSRSLTWLFDYQLPRIARAASRRAGSPPVLLLLAELWGCAAGPWAYLSARRRLRRGLAAG
ncbi:MAG: glycosyltransferase [Armatimonadota bacterium]|nr:glycosyltransferase [Armatimonadota bacterium]